MKLSRVVVGVAVVGSGFCSSMANAQQFTEVTSQVGLVMEAKKSWGNPVWGDINNDGYLDLIVPTHGLLLSRGPFVYLNNHGTSFTDIRTTCGIGRNNPDTSDWHGYSFGDYNGDGYLDVYIAEGAKKGAKIKSDELFLGHGDGTFTYASRSAGIETSTNRGRCGFWLDYDNDGLLDLFVKNFEDVNVLYRNNGNGSFTEVPNAAGLAKATLNNTEGSICSFFDYDNDGYMDVFFSGDRTPDVLYRNLGNGTFVDVTAQAGILPLTNGHGIAWGDYDNDGYPDLYVARSGLSLNGQTVDTLYHNNGDGTFTDVTAAAHLQVNAQTWAAVWGDYDNDGYLDLFVTNAGQDSAGKRNANLLYHNNGDGTFTEVAAAAGVDLRDDVSLHKGASWADYDNDGFLDLLTKDGIGNEGDNGPGAFGVHRLFRNNGNQNHFIKVNLVGVVSNRQGIGARATATFGTTKAYRQNNGGGGGEYASQGSEPLHFGIGQANAATIVVTWPSGIVDTLPNVPANSTTTVTEGTHP